MITGGLTAAIPGSIPSAYANDATLILSAGDPFTMGEVTLTPTVGVYQTDSVIRIRSILSESESLSPLNVEIVLAEEQAID